MGDRDEGPLERDIRNLTDEELDRVMEAELRRSVLIVQSFRSAESRVGYHLKVSVNVRYGNLKPRVLPGVVGGIPRTKLAVLIRNVLAYI